MNPTFRKCVLALPLPLLLPNTPAFADEWKGAYFGGALTALSSEGSINTGSGTFKDDRTAPMVGLALGYNWGVLGPRKSNTGFRLGTQFDFAVGNGTDTANDPTLGSVDIQGKFAASLRLKAGYSWPNTFAYTSIGTAGSDYHIVPAGTSDRLFSASGSLGLGVDHKLRNGWTVQAEYFGNETLFPQNFNGTDRDVENKSSQLRLGFLRKF